MVSAVNPGPKRYAASALTGSSRAHQLFHDKHYGGRTHIAKVFQNGAGNGQFFRLQLKTCSDCIENRAAAWMHSPQFDVAVGIQITGIFTQGLPQFSWNLAGELHVESRISNTPADQIARVGYFDSPEPVECNAMTICADQACGAAIAEEQE